MKANIKESIRLLIEEAFNAGNTSVLDAIIHPNYVYRSPNETMQGPEELKGFIAGFRAAFPDLNIERLS